MGEWATAGTASTAITSDPTTARSVSAIRTARLTPGPSAIARAERLGGELCSRISAWCVRSIATLWAARSLRPAPLPTSPALLPPRLARPPSRHVSANRKWVVGNGWWLVVASRLRASSDHPHPTLSRGDRPAFSPAAFDAMIDPEGVTLISPGQRPGSASPSYCGTPTGCDRSAFKGGSRPFRATIVNMYRGPRALSWADESRRFAATEANGLTHLSRKLDDLRGGRGGAGRMPVQTALTQPSPRGRGL
jgi:hypothetical protein